VAGGHIIENPKRRKEDITERVERMEIPQSIKGKEPAYYSGFSGGMAYTRKTRGIFFERNIWIKVFEDHKSRWKDKGYWNEKLQQEMTGK
jgi:hypothetical protein